MASASDPPSYPSCAASEYCFLPPFWLKVRYQIIVMTCVWLCPESPRYLVSRGKKEEALVILTEHHTNDGKINAVVEVRYILSYFMQIQPTQCTSGSDTARDEGDRGKRHAQASKFCMLKLFSYTRRRLADHRHPDSGGIIVLCSEVGMPVRSATRSIYHRTIG